MAYEAIIYEKREDIAYLTLNRPESLNALNDKLRQEMGEAVQDARDDASVRVVILTGAGERAFSAGLDLRELSQRAPMPVTESRRFRGRFVSAIASLDKPVIGAINGLAYGGGNELAMQCDIIVASEQASFAQMEVKRGLIPGAGGTQRLPRLVGKNRAMEIILTGQPINAQEAYRIGLVNKVVPHDQLIPAAEEIAYLIIANAPLAVRFGKEAVKRGLEMTLDEGLIVEGDLSAILANTEDAKEGPRAFTEKRTPQWQGR